MTLTPATHSRFSRFAAHMREQTNAATDFPSTRLKIYQRLFANNVQSLLRQSFPVASKMLDRSAATHGNEQSFKQLVTDFYREHRCKTPRFTEIAPELIMYLEGDIRWLQPWPKQALIELLHYEWLETELALSPLVLSSASDRELTSDRRVSLSPLALPLAYHFSVTHLSAQCLPTQMSAEPTLLLLWRDRTQSVRFQSLSIGALQLALRLQQSELPVTELDPASLDLVRTWVARDCVLLS